MSHFLAEHFCAVATACGSRSYAAIRKTTINTTPISPDTWQGVATWRIIGTLGPARSNVHDKNNSKKHVLVQNASCRLFREFHHMVLNCRTFRFGVLGILIQCEPPKYL